MYNVHRIQVMRKNLPKIYEASKFNSQMHVIIITLLKGSSPKYAQQNIIYKVESKTWKKDSNCFADKSYLQQKSADRLSELEMPSCSLGSRQEEGKVWAMLQTVFVIKKILFLL